MNPLINAQKVVGLLGFGSIGKLQNMAVMQKEKETAIR